MAASAPTATTSAKAKKRHLLTTANGKKLVMAVTGLSLCLFLVFHLAGNLLLLQPGGDWFNTYATVLNKIILLPLIELGLAAIVLIHAFEGYTVWKGNKAARGSQDYHYKEWTKQNKSKKSKKSVGSTTMMATGIILLGFMVGHVWHFKYHNSIGPANPISAHKAGEAAEVIAATGGKQETPQETMQLAQHVVYEMQKWYVMVLYIVCLAAVALHLYHAVGSSLQTLGAGGSKFGQIIWYFSRAFSVVIGGGFIVLALYISLFAKPDVYKKAEATKTTSHSAPTAP